MNVVATAPIPGNNTPSFPRGEAILFGFSMNFLSFSLGGNTRAQQFVSDTVSQIINFGGRDSDMQMKTTLASSHPADRALFISCRSPILPCPTLHEPPALPSA